MSSLSPTDKTILEQLLGMGSGYVLNFTNNSMAEFFRGEVGINIYDSRYSYGSNSKANYMRGFWKTGSDILVGKSIQKLIAYIKVQIQIGA